MSCKKLYIFGKRFTDLKAVPFLSFSRKVPLIRQKNGPNSVHLTAPLSKLNMLSAFLVKSTASNFELMKCLNRLQESNWLFLYLAQPTRLPPPVLTLLQLQTQWPPGSNSSTLTVSTLIMKYALFLFF